MVAVDQRRDAVKTFVLIALGVLLGVGLYFAWKMWKGEGICGWGGSSEAGPWSSYTPPAQEGESAEGAASS